jgi:ATP dependent DNA ligase-like protein
MKSNLNGLNYRFPSLARSLRGFAVDTVILDGEVVAIDENGQLDFAALFTAEPELVQFWAFNLLGVDGRVLATSPLLERRRELTHVFENPPEGYLLSETFEDAKALLGAADRFGLEGRAEMNQSESLRWVPFGCIAPRVVVPYYKNMRSAFVFTSSEADIAQAGALGQRHASSGFRSCVFSMGRRYE